jgi:hypothetical protein
MTPLLAFGAIALVEPAHAADEPAWGRVLAACVSANGVDYACVRSHRADLESFLKSVEAPQSGTPPLGFWIDAYNASVVGALATESALPKQIIDLAGFFDKRTFPVNGRAETLNALEAHVRADFHDARAHFAFNCAARSCPPLRATPWPDDPAAIGPALEAATAAFLAGPGVTVSTEKRELRLSKLFDWYGDDFRKEQPTVQAWVLAHLADPSKTAAVEAAVREGYTVTFLPYDWTPNAR